MADLQAISESLQQGNAPKVKELVQEALDEGTGVEVILDEGLIAGMGVIGEKFKKNEVYVPEVLIAARAMNAGMEVLAPELEKAGVQPIGRVAIGTVKGDLHDIGKNLVGIMLKGAGFEVIDLGNDVAPEAFIEAARENGAGVIGMSALLTTTMRVMEHTIKALEEAGLRDRVKVMIGGAPVTQAFADQIGADGYASNAASAADLAKKFAGAA